MTFKTLFSICERMGGCVLPFQHCFCMEGQDGIWFECYSNGWAKHTLGNGNMEVYDDIVFLIETRSGSGSSRVMDLLYSSSFLVSW